MSYVNTETGEVVDAHRFERMQRLMNLAERRHTTPPRRPIRVVDRRPVQDVNHTREILWAITALVGFFLAMWFIAAL